MRFIEHGVLLERVGDRESRGERDCIYRSAYAAMAYGDFRLVWNCLHLCDGKIRWPVRLGEPSKRMTRDPYIITICAAYLLDASYDSQPEYGIDKIKSYLKIPWYLYRPHVWAWRKYLITGSEKWKRRYERRAILGLKISKNRMFSLCLEAWMAYVADSDKVKLEVWFKSPTWNKLISILCCSEIEPDLKIVFEDYITNYRPKDRNQWTESKWRNDGYYTGEYKIDKDILTYLLNKD